MKGYNEISRRLESFKSWTDFTVRMDVCGWEMHGLRSPYVSHQSVSLLSGHQIANLIVLGEEPRTLYLSPRLVEAGDMLIESERTQWGQQYVLSNGSRVSWDAVIAQGPIVSRILQAEHFLPLWGFPLLVPLWAREGLLHVFYPDRFSGYGEAGKPRFEADISLTLLGSGNFLDAIRRHSEGENIPPPFVDDSILQCEG